jgi:hypothetical protein
MITVLVFSSPFSNSLMVISSKAKVEEKDLPTAALQHQFFLTATLFSTAAQQHWLLVIRD